MILAQGSPLRWWVFTTKCQNDPILVIPAEHLFSAGIGRLSAMPWRPKTSPFTNSSGGISISKTGSFIEYRTLLSTGWLASAQSRFTGWSYTKSTRNLSWSLDVLDSVAVRQELWHAAAAT